MSPPSKQRNVWKTAALKYAIPKLPGQWQVFNRVLILKPFGPIARGVAANDNTLITILEPLFMPLSYPNVGWLAAIECYVPGVFAYHELKHGERQAEEYMAQLADTVTETVLPYLTENGSMEGFYEVCQRRHVDHPSGFGDPYVLYQQAAAAIMLQRPEDARKALDGVRKSIDWAPADEQESVQDLYEQAGALRESLIADPEAVREELLSGMDEQKRRRKLPLTS